MQAARDTEASSITLQVQQPGQAAYSKDRNVHILPSWGRIYRLLYFK